MSACQHTSARQHAVRYTKFVYVGTPTHTIQLDTHRHLSRPHTSHPPIIIKRRCATFPCRLPWSHRPLTSPKSRTTHTHTRARALLHPEILLPHNVSLAPYYRQAPRVLLHKFKMVIKTQLWHSANAASTQGMDWPCAVMARLYSLLEEGHVDVQSEEEAAEARVDDGMAPPPQEEPGQPQEAHTTRKVVNM